MTLDAQIPFRQLNKTLLVLYKQIKSYSAKFDRLGL